MKIIEKLNVSGHKKINWNTDISIYLHFVSDRCHIAAAELSNHNRDFVAQKSWKYFLTGLYRKHLLTPALRSKLVKENWGAMKSWTESRAWDINEWISRENVRANAFNPFPLKMHCSFFFIHVILSSSHAGFKNLEVPLLCETTSD